MVTRSAFGLVLAATTAFGAAGENIIPNSSCESYICLEAETGMIIAEYNADTVRPPASMVKMLMLLMVIEGVEEGAWTMDTPIVTSAKAQSMGGTQVFLKAGEEHTVLRLAMAAAIASANDATMALAEGLWGSEEAYLTAMNARALELGMTNSHFYSVHGLPPTDGVSFDQTTARDMATLARACIKKPLIMEWVKQPEFAFRPGLAPKANTNKLLGWMPDCDGLKTGYIRAAGFCVSATAQRDGVRLLTVVMGCASNTERFRSAQDVLESGFADVRRVRILEKGEPINRSVRVANSALRELRPLAEEDLWIVAKEDELESIRLVMELPGKIYAPLSGGTSLGSVRAVVGEEVRGEVAVAAPEQVVEAGWRWKLMEGARAVRPVGTLEGGD